MLYCRRCSLSTFLIHSSPLTQRWRKCRARYRNDIPHRTLIEQLDRSGFGLTTWAPIGLFMPGCDPVQPDIVMIQTSDLGIIHDRRIFGIPTLLVEILSPTNPETDLQIKRGAYARAGVPEYWIVRPATRDVLVCSRPDATLGDYVQTQLSDADGALVSPTLPFQATVADFFAGAPDTTL